MYERFEGETTDRIPLGRERSTRQPRAWVETKLTHRSLLGMPWRLSIAVLWVSLASPAKCGHLENEQC